MRRLNPDNLYVEFRNGVTMTKPVIGRKYTLTHSDITADLFLTIGLQFAYDKINVMRDEVLAEWRTNHEFPLIILNIFIGNTNKAIEKFIKYHKEDINEECLDIYETRRIKDSEVISIIKSICNVAQSTDIQDLDKDTREKYLIELKNRGLSTR